MSLSARKDQRFDLRVSPQQRTLIQRAAEQLGRSTSDFILDSATEKAADVLADRRLILVDDEQWARFQAALEAPATTIPALVELFRDKDL